MNRDILHELTEKLMEDTKQNRIKWLKPTGAGIYNIDRKKYYANIKEIGEIYISKTNNNELYFNISERENENNYEDVIDYNSEYYVKMMRLYNLARSSYMKRISSGSLEKAITAYINGAD